jgi:hypothetical protein
LIRTRQLDRNGARGLPIAPEKRPSTRQYCSLFFRRAGRQELDCNPDFKIRRHFGEGQPFCFAPSVLDHMFKAWRERLAWREMILFLCLIENIRLTPRNSEVRSKQQQLTGE